MAIAWESVPTEKLTLHELSSLALGPAKDSADINLAMMGRALNRSEGSSESDRELLYDRGETILNPIAQILGIEIDEFFFRSVLKFSQFVGETIPMGSGILTPEQSAEFGRVPPWVSAAKFEAIVEAVLAAFPVWSETQVVYIRRSVGAMLFVVLVENADCDVFGIPD